MNAIPEKRKSRQWIRRSFTAGGCAVSVMVVIGIVGICMQPVPRYTVIGPTDPTTGVHIEFTVSSHYLRQLDPSYEPAKNSFPHWLYTPKADSPVRDWVQTVILRQPAGPEDFSQTSTIPFGLKFEGWLMDPQGVVSVDPNHLPMWMKRVPSQEFKMVEDCPTTLFVENTGFFQGGHSIEIYHLIVRPTRQSVTRSSVFYEFGAVGFQGISQNLHELKAIRDSIRVVKTK